MAEQAVRFPQPPAHHGEHVHGGVGVGAEERLQVMAVNPNSPGVRDGPRAGASRVTVQQGQLAEEVAVLGRLEDNPLAGGVHDEYLHLARLDDVDGVTRLAAAEDLLSGAKGDVVYLRGQEGAL